MNLAIKKSKKKNTFKISYKISEILWKITFQRDGPFCATANGEFQRPAERDERVG